MSEDVDSALDTANYDKLLRSGLQVQTEEDTEVLRKIQSDKPMILVMNKIDCAPPDCCERVEETKEEVFHKSVFTSAVTGQGIEELEEAILEIIDLYRVPTGGHQWTVNQIQFYM